MSDLQQFSLNTSLSFPEPLETSFKASLEPFIWPESTIFEQDLLVAPNEDFSLEAMK